MAHAFINQSENTQGIGTLLSENVAGVSTPCWKKQHFIQRKCIVFSRWNEAPAYLHDINT